MPVSSSASRSATRARLASPSACPPGCSHRCTLAWNRQQHLAGARVDDRRRAGEVALEARAVQRVGVVVDEGEDPRPVRLVARGRPGGPRRTAARAAARSSGAVELGRQREQRGHAGFERWSEPGRAPAPRVLGAGRQADAGAHGRDVGRRRAVVDDRHAPVGGDEVGAVEGAGRARRPGTAGPGRQQVAVAPRRRPASARISSSPAPARPPAAARPPPPLVAAHRVGAPVHAVGEVHVEAAGRPEHRGVALRHAPVGVAARVLGAAVGLDLHDASRPSAVATSSLPAARAPPPAGRAGRTRAARRRRRAIRTRRRGTRRARARSRSCRCRPPRR